jgi:hypothetical protein
MSYVIMVDTALTPGMLPEAPPSRKLWRGIYIEIWAWVELNYRPHAYQTAAGRWVALTGVDFLGFRSLHR